jgi:hypothetical protein
VGRRGQRIGGFERRLSLQTWIFGILTDIVPSPRDPTIQDKNAAARYASISVTAICTDSPKEAHKISGVSGDVGVVSRAETAHGGLTFLSACESSCRISRSEPS